MSAQDGIALAQKQFGEIGAVLARDARDDGFFHFASFLSSSGTRARIPSSSAMRGFQPVVNILAESQSFRGVPSGLERSHSKRTSASSARLTVAASSARV